jgi:pimeloyl-ACP methyl ester carboxylesterase
LITLLLVLPGVLLAQAIWQLVCVRIDARKFPPPGKLIDVAAGRMHVRQLGAGLPAVMLESGIAASSLNWSLLQPRLSTMAATYSYDRAGFGWSSARGRACTLHKITDELHELVTALDVPKPYVLAGHSFAGYILRLYARRFADELAGVILVDPLTPEEWVRPNRAQRWQLRRGVWFSRAGGVLAALGVVRFCLWLVQRGNRTAPRRVLGWFGAQAKETVQRILSELAKLPPETVRLIRERWSQPRFYWTLAAYIRSIPACAAEIYGCDIPERVPVTVISGAHQPRMRMAEHMAIAAHSSRGRHIIAAQSAHWIHLDQPDLIAAAFRQMAETVKVEALHRSQPAGPTY